MTLSIGLPVAFTTLLAISCLRMQTLLHVGLALAVQACTMVAVAARCMVASTAALE